MCKGVGGEEGAWGGEGQILKGLLDGFVYGQSCLLVLVEAMGTRIGQSSHVAIDRNQHQLA